MARCLSTVRNRTKGRERLRPPGSPVVAELHDVSVRVEHVETAPVAPCPPAPIRSADDVETARGGHRVEIGRFDDEADVIDVLSGSLGLEEVDDRRLVEPQRREEDLAAPPLLDAQA